MTPSAAKELRLPSFWLALAGGLAGVCGWIFTLGVTSSRLDAATEKNAAQDVAIVEVKKELADDAKENREAVERLRREMQAGFDRLSDKIDATRGSR